ncbi:hypothetical protein BpHYR1_008387 [Brachionus plicatilis]|uniref:Uncharacterized protein n=1 Tax=Brachionus plicatilis TaxID=10195 RepID=A0A3M7RCZ6_BRAPC|nr:hypothetical protein BpHYR1_008387 [Brachionus plicatilis]
MSKIKITTKYTADLIKQASYQKIYELLVMTLTESLVHSHPSEDYKFFFKTKVLTFFILLVFKIKISTIHHADLIPGFLVIVQNEQKFFLFRAPFFTLNNSSGGQSRVVFFTSMKCPSIIRSFSDSIHELGGNIVLDEYMDISILFIFKQNDFLNRLRYKIHQVSHSIVANLILGFLAILKYFQANKPTTLSTTKQHTTPTDIRTHFILNDLGNNIDCPDGGCWSLLHSIESKSSRSKSTSDSSEPPDSASLALTMSKTTSKRKQTEVTENTDEIKDVVERGPT